MPINYTGSGGGVPRKTAKIFGKNAASADMTVFGSTLGGNTVYSTDLDSIQSARYETGWRDAVVSNLNYPLLSDMNAVQHTLSQQIAYTLQHGIPEYDSGTTYYAYDKVQYNDIIYTALQDNFSNKLPTNTSYWAEYYSTDYFANKSLSNLNATGEKHFVNKTQVTNCILEAPLINSRITVWTVSGSTLTIKAGVKVLIPNGRNADGSLNNIEYTVANDISYTYGVSPNPSGPIINDYIFLRADGTIERLNGNFVFMVANGYQLNLQTGNNQYRIAYVEENNLWYETVDYGANWSEMGMTLIGKLNVESNNAISNERPDLTLSAWSNSTTSKSILSTTASFPSDWLWVDLSGLWTGASPTNYVAPADGYVTLWRQALAETDWICLAQALTNGTGGVTCVSSTGGYVQNVDFNYLHAFLPVQKGSTFTLTHRGAGALLSFKFIYAKGEE